MPENLQPSPRSSLTSRERILTTLRHEEPDRLPIDLGGMASTGIMAIAYARLKEHLGLTGGATRIFDMGQQLAEVEPEIITRFGVDVVALENSLGGAPSETWKPWILPDGTPCQVPAEVDIRLDEENGGWLIWENNIPIRRMLPSGLYFEEIHHPLADLSPVEALKHLPGEVLGEEDLRRLEKRAKKLHNNTEFAILANFGGSLLEKGSSLRGFQRFLLDLAKGGAFVQDLLGSILETTLATLRLYLQAVGGYVHIIQFGDDLGMQDRPLISREMYQRYIMPGHQQLFQHVHQNSNCAVFFHSCGSIRPLIPDLVAAGVDILNPLQTGAKDMDPRQLKEEFGKQITFWGGGCDTQHVLPFTTTEEVKQHVREQVGILAPGGGFVFSPIHNIQADVSAENILAMYDAAREFSYSS